MASKPASQVSDPEDPPEKVLPASQSLESLRREITSTAGGSRAAQVPAPVTVRRKTPEPQGHTTPAAKRLGGTRKLVPHRGHSKTVEPVQAWHAPQ